MYHDERSCEYQILLTSVINKAPYQTNFAFCIASVKRKTSKTE